MWIIFKNPCYFFYGFILFLLQFWASLMAQLVKNPPVMQETPVRFVGWEDPLENGKVTHSSILGLFLRLSWQRICLQCRRLGFSPGVGKIPWRRERLPTPVFWPGEFHGLYSPWGRKQLDTTEQLSLSIFWRTWVSRYWKWRYSDSVLYLLFGYLVIKFT